jgi:hypothetical protein
VGELIAMKTASGDIPEALFDQLKSAFNGRAWHQVLALAARLFPLAPKHTDIYFLTDMASP